MPLRLGAIAGRSGAISPSASRCQMKQVILRVLRKPAAWIAIAALLASAGLNPSPAMVKLIEMLGPEIISAVDDKGGQ